MKEYEFYIWGGSYYIWGVWGVMLIFGFILNGSGKEQIKKFNDNLNDPDKLISSRLFVGEIKNIKYDFYICKIDYLFPMPTIILLIAFVTGVIFKILPLILISLVLIFLVQFLQSRYFYFIILIWGLKKFGYKGRIKMLSYQETIEKLMMQTK